MRLTILTGDRPADPLYWVQTDDGKPVDGGEVAALDALAEAIGEGGDHVTVILPGERFAIRRLNAPARNTRQMMQAARFLLEDELAGPVDELHVALAAAPETTGETEVSAPAGRPVIAVERDWLAGWVEALRTAGFTPDILTCDVLAAGVEGQAVMLVEADRLALNLFGEGFAADRPLADEMAHYLLAASAPKGVGIISVGHVTMPALPEAMKTQGAPVRDRKGLAFFLAGHVAHNAPVNLLQGEFERGVDWREAARPWRLAGALAAACAVLYLVLIGFEAASLHGAADRLERETSAAFAAAYPDLPQRNIRTQARRLAAQDGGTNTQFLRLSSQLASAIEAQENVQLAAVSYDAADQLVADIRFAEPSVLEDLKASLSGQGIVVREGRNLSRDADAYLGKLYLSVSS